MKCGGFAARPASSSQRFGRLFSIRDSRISNATAQPPPSGRRRPRQARCPWRAQALVCRARRIIREPRPAGGETPRRPTQRLRRPRRKTCAQPHGAPSTSFASRPCAGRGLEVDAKAVGDTIDEREIRHDGARVMDRAVAQSLVSEGAHIIGRHRARRACQLLGVLEQCLVCRRQPGARGVERPARQRGDERLGVIGRSPRGLRDLTETRSVMV